MDDKDFRSKPLSSLLKKSMVSQNIWSQNCPIPLERLVLLKLKHFNFSGNKKNGEMVVLDVAAKGTLAIFYALYNAKFPIHKIRLINEYLGNDNKAMRDNNSSAFNCRKIAGSSDFSIHAYGLAIDINPMQNPIICGDKILPSQGANYIDRSDIRPGMVENKYNGKETVIELFARNGFTIWGGNWQSPVDLHHFQPTRDIARIIANSTIEEGAKAFQQASI